MLGFLIAVWPFALQVPVEGLLKLVFASHALRPCMHSYAQLLHFWIAAVPSEY